MLEVKNEDRDEGEVGGVGRSWGGVGRGGGGMEVGGGGAEAANEG